MNNRNRKKQWHRLDNAAKIFPATTGKRDTKVFRFACELKETIEQDILQNALEQTIIEFPMFLSIMRKGLFWYYFEATDKKAMVHKEDRKPCDTLYDPNEKSLLFDVSFYEKRINLEVHHSLTDGTGAVLFLRTLVYHYLLLKHKECLLEKQIAMDYDASLEQRMDDSFRRHYDDSKKESMVTKTAIFRKRAHKLKGQKLSEYRLRVLEGNVSVKEVIAAAHKYNTTLTVFLTALIMLSIGETMSMREKKRSVGIVVPVNLRNYFPSESARNFFGTIDVFYNFRQGTGTFEDIINSIEKSFKEELTKEKMAERVYKLGALERNPFARVVPLVIKDFFLKIAYEIAELRYTFSISNVGRIKMPAELVPWIHSFDVFVSTKKKQVCMCSFEDALTISFTSPLVSTEIEKIFFRKLSDMGIHVRVATNHWSDQDTKEVGKEENHGVL